MNSDKETVLENAIQALRSDRPDAAQVSASAQRVADRLGIDTTQHVGVDWARPQPTRAFTWRPRAFGWTLAPALALLAGSFFVYRAYWQVPPGVRAEVQSIDGSAYAITDGGDHQLSPGDNLIEGESIRTSGGAHAVLRLMDGSKVEVNERSALEVGERGRNTTIALDNGAVIVQAAHRSSGHLYVKTADCRVAVTGTVFSVNAGIKGSRVGVLQGSLHVTHAGIDTAMRAGEQITTNENLSPEPLDQQIAWSHDRDKYLMLLAQFDVLQRRIEQIPSPQLRYTSDLLQRVPASTLLYVSIPNFGDFLNEANGIFKDQLKDSPALQQWWSSGAGKNSDELDAMVDKLHQMSQYLGDEVVVVGLKQADNPGFAVMADVQRSGLDNFLKTQLLLPGSTSGFTVFNEASLAAAPISGPVSTSKSATGEYALVREHEVVFSNSVATLKQLNAQLNAGASGFATGDFGQQIGSAYSRGAGVILAADLQQMLHERTESLRAEASSNRAFDESGMNQVRYLIAEHRELKGLPENHASLQFAGTREGVASWLAAPAPIGSLDFVTPNAALAVAFLSKDPAAIADDIMHMAAPDHSDAQKQWSDTEAKLQVDIRNDLAANLGGDFLVALDGPVLPTPAWKAVIEVHDSERLEQTIERLVQAANSEAGNQQSGKHMHTVAISSSESAGQRYYSVRDVTSGSTVAQYTFADGYMIVAPDRAFLIQAIHTHESGDSLAHAESFKALLPQDENANYSAVAYQNVGPVLAPLLSQFSGDMANAVRQIASDARPTAICAWGKDSRIEVASNSHLFGFDFLALESLIHPDTQGTGNKQADPSVKE